MTDKPDQKTMAEPHTIMDQLVSEQQHEVVMQIVEILKPFTPAQRRKLILGAMERIGVVSK